MYQSSIQMLVKLVFWTSSKEHMAWNKDFNHLLLHNLICRLWIHRILNNIYVDFKSDLFWIVSMLNSLFCKQMWLKITINY